MISMGTRPMIDPLLAERRRLGPVRVHTLRASSLPAAHAALGALVARPARSAVAARIAATKPAVLAEQIACARASRAFLERRASVGPRAGTPAAVKAAVAEYVECLDAWSAAVGLGPCAARCPHVGGQPVSAGDLALWMQDDNSGCQTGLVRRPDGSVLLWHTEEDTIGYFDKPRVVSIEVGGVTRSAFLYAYLLPGPAFGWQRDQIHAVDSLVMRREGAPVGAFTSAAAWLIWRLGPEVPAREALRALSPYVDGCVIHVARPGERAAFAESHEIGGRHVVSLRLPQRAGAARLQVNLVSRPESPLAPEEEVSSRSRGRYSRRARRMEEDLARLAQRGTPDGARILRMIASRRGGGFAYANLDVKAHCVAEIDPDGVAIHVGSGAACPGDVYLPRRG
jgi:hypothetical protein